MNWKTKILWLKVDYLGEENLTGLKIQTVTYNTFLCSSIRTCFHGAVQGLGVVQISILYSIYNHISYEVVGSCVYNHR
jgi:hypothetical protein